MKFTTIRREISTSMSTHQENLEHCDVGNEHVLADVTEKERS